MKHRPEIFFHVGLGKVASTYLQYQFFPKLQGIRYIQRTRYRHSPRLIARSQARRILVSREFDRQLEEEVRWFSGYFHDVRPILLLRPHGSWIASQYRRWIKNGRPDSFQDFFDIEGDTGHWKHKDGLFYPKIEALEAAFDHPPLVLFYEELRRDPWSFFDRLSNYMGATYDRSAISLEPQHRSYTQRELLFLRRASPHFHNPHRNPSSNPVLRTVQRYARLLTVYSVMAASHLLPSSSIPCEPLIPPGALEAIDQAYREDWQACLRYAARQAKPAAS